MQILFALDTTELSRVFLSNELTRETPVNLVHDPQMQSANQGQARCENALFTAHIDA